MQYTPINSVFFLLPSTHTLTLTSWQHCMHSSILRNLDTSWRWTKLCNDPMIVFSVGLTWATVLRFALPCFDGKKTLSRDPAVAYFFSPGQSQSTVCQQQHIFHFEKQLKRTWSVFENKHIYTMVSQKNFCDVFDAVFSIAVFSVGCYLFCSF